VCRRAGPARGAGWRNYARACRRFRYRTRRSAPQIARQGSCAAGRPGRFSPGSDSPPAVQDVNKSEGGGSAPTPPTPCPHHGYAAYAGKGCQFCQSLAAGERRCGMCGFVGRESREDGCPECDPIILPPGWGAHAPPDRCEKCNAVLLASNMCVECGHVHGVSTTGAASLHAGEDAAAQVAPPGDLAPPPSATAGENPARSFSRKAKPGTPCGGPSCRDSITNWIHDPRTCPLYAGKRSA
jgi:hypothetical protein